MRTGRQFPRKAVFAANTPGSIAPPMAVMRDLGMPRRKDSIVSPARIPSAAIMYVCFFSWGGGFVEDDEEERGGDGLEEDDGEERSGVVGEVMGDINAR